MAKSPINLRFSFAPVAWSGGRAPHRTIINQALAQALPMSGGSRILRIADGIWPEDAERILRVDHPTPAFTDTVVEDLRLRYSGMVAIADGDLFGGVFTSIIGQGVSVKAAATFQNRIARHVNPPVSTAGCTLIPLPTAEQVAAVPATELKAHGITTKRAEGLVHVAQAFLAQPVPLNEDETLRWLRSLPMIGPWTAASALLWGVGAQDVYPPGDVALLRAARLAYNRPAMTMKELNVLSDTWRPFRADAARLLWLNLLGPAWDDADTSGAETSD